jgi:hypothetical protein
MVYFFPTAELKNRIESMTNFENPILIGKVIEKKDFDNFVEYFRAREKEFDEQIREEDLTKAELDYALHTFEESSKQYCKNMLGIDIDIRKCNSHKHRYAIPALIVLKEMEFYEG